MQIPLVSGIYTDTSPELRVSYPINLLVTPSPSSGVGDYYLRPGEGIKKFADTSGLDRGAYNWQGSHYRVIGTQLVLIDALGNINVLGDVGGNSTQFVKFANSFERLAIVSDGSLYYYDGSTFVKVTDPDLGYIIDVAFNGGYFVLTDGENIIVTDLTDPTSINPLKYGSSEADPDPVVGILNLRNEICAINRFTIELFDNVGGDFFPFQVIDGAQIQKGAIGNSAFCLFDEKIAFVGSGKGESTGIYLGVNASTEMISTQEINNILLSYSESELSQIKIEYRQDRANKFLYVHLPEKTLVYNHSASEELNLRIWQVLNSGESKNTQYRARNFVFVYNQWFCGDTQANQIGYLTEDIGTHWGNSIYWECSTKITYNETKGVNFNRLELVALTGNYELNKTPYVYTQYTTDGLFWSQPKSVSCGTIGNTRKRLVWFANGFMRKTRMQRFFGYSDAHISILGLDAQLTGFNA